MAAVFEQRHMFVKERIPYYALELDPRMVDARCDTVGLCNSSYITRVLERCITEVDPYKVSLDDDLAVEVAVGARVFVRKRSYDDGGMDRVAYLAIDASHVAHLDTTEEAVASALLWLAVEIKAMPRGASAELLQYEERVDALIPVPADAVAIPPRVAEAPEEE